MDGHEIANYGEYHHETVNIVHGETVPLNAELVREAAKRFMEEAVELALACGLTPAETLVHVTDGLHNEAKKGKRYPSEFRRHDPDHDEVAEEIVDVIICADYIRHARKISMAYIDGNVTSKLYALRRRAEHGDYVAVGKRIYKKEARR